MEHDELVENVLEVFETCYQKEPYTLKDFQHDLYEGTEGTEIATQEDIRDACEQLVAEGFLQRMGEDAYALTDAHLARLELDDEESFLAIYREHLRKQEGKK